MTDLRSFIKQQSVYSKLSEKPIVGQYGPLTLVFVHGYPMTLRGFYALTSKAVFGATVPVNKKAWGELNAETILLCQGLGLKLTTGSEAQSVIDGIRTSAGWAKETTQQMNMYNFDTKFLISWLAEVEDQVKRFKEV